MSTITPIMNLTKAEDADLADILVFSENMQKIENWIKTNIIDNPPTVGVGEITTEKLANGSVTNEKLSPDSVTDANIVDINGFKIQSKTIGLLEKINCDIVEVTSDLLADEDDGVPHSLGRIPSGYIVIGKNKPATIYTGETPWTATSIFLKSNIAQTTYKVMIF